ncbi:hypothetical protein ZIOFF_059325 [Zingiber officinale]|uniref:Endoglucanase n=1 Tax=Zingiber officinale TaxID=94328 RepID=A0A8J5KMK0_ZINOF|nr:hypothetical protein ZIOFF_059325 [Zingiber officinale]
MEKVEEYRKIFLLFLLFSSVPRLVAFDYGEALSKSLLYFEAQRSGRLPHRQRISWRSDSGLTDGLEQRVDLVGGYYDAGDHVKFGLPMAFTATMLAWGAAEYGGAIAAAGEMEHALGAIKWATDYFIKAHTLPNLLWAQVRMLPTSSNTNPRYSRLLLHHAQQLFEFGDKYRGRYDESIPAAKSYYPSVSGYGDELLWAAMWLHRATRQAKYLTYAVEKAAELGGAGWAVSEFSWDIKYAGLQILASKLLMEEGRRNLEEKRVEVLEQYRSKAQHYICSCLNMSTADSNVRRTPGGLLFVREWNNMQYVTGAAFLLTVYSDYLTASGELLHCPRGSLGPREILSFVKVQVDYMLGSNPLGMSYMVGFGRKYPKRVHHRAASTISYKKDGSFIGCAQGYDKWFGRRKENPNILIGAIVGGPNAKDRFKDMRENYMQTEACTYNTAPMVGVFAKLHHLKAQSSSSSS